MNDTRGIPKSGLLIKLRWPSEKVVSGENYYVDMELQDANGQTLASLRVPAEHLLNAAAQQLGQHTVVSLNGFALVTSEKGMVSLAENRPIALDQLVAQATSLDMLEDEPEAAQMLAEFRARLLKSLELVDQAIATLPKP